MTTSIHVVNFGPLAVEVETDSKQKWTLYPHQSQNFSVYTNETVRVKEVQPDNSKPTEK